jgi:hypothetical protein
MAAMNASPGERVPATTHAHSCVGSRICSYTKALCNLYGMNAVLCAADGDTVCVRNVLW